MKIGVLTQPLHNNYGGLLQAYALQRTLKKFGHEAVVLNRSAPEAPHIKRLLKICKAILLRYCFNRKGVEIIQFVPKDYQKKFIAKNTTSFIKEHIETTEVLLSSEELKEHVENKGYDALIVGSDQVWRPRYSPCITDYFFKFLENDSSIKKVAYAASFGVDSWEFSKWQTKQCGKLALLFDAVSVRELSAVELCRKFLNVESQHVLDPTLLLDEMDYTELISQAGESISDGDMMTYILDKNPDKDDIIERVAACTGYKSFSVMPDSQLSRNSQHNLEACVYPPVTKWLCGFKEAKFVVTDSFHGCVFALIFNKPFIVIGNENRGLTRFSSFLELFELRDRLLQPLNDSIEKLVKQNIDWEQINLKRKILLNSSLRFLSDNL